MRYKRLIAETKIVVAQYDENLVFVQYVTKNIAEIQVGDIVLAKDQHAPDGELMHCVVVNTFVHENKEVTTVTLTHSVTGEVLEITGTSEHPFYVTGKGFVNLSDLELGDICVAPDGSHFVVTDITPQEERQTVYNFEVQFAHTYYVGSGFVNAVLVHNQCTVFGEKFVAPWDPNADWGWESVKQYGRAAKRATIGGVSGGVSGALTGAGTGAISGGIVGSFFGGVGAGPGALAGGKAGAVSGGVVGTITGVIDAAMMPPHTPALDVIQGAAQSGGITGAVAGGIAGGNAAANLPGEPVIDAADRLRHHTDAQGLQGIQKDGVIDAARGNVVNFEEEPFGVPFGRLRLSPGINRQVLVV